MNLRIIQLYEIDRVVHISLLLVGVAPIRLVHTRERLRKQLRLWCIFVARLASAPLTTLTISLSTSSIHLDPQIR